MSVITPPDDAAVDVADEPQQSLIKRITSVQSVWILGVLLVIVAFFSVTAGERFFSISNFSLISQNIAVWAVLGVGMTFVIITSGIDLSIGSVLVFSSVVSALVMQRIGGEGWGTAIIGILAALVTGVLWGLLNGALVAKAKIPPLIVTLGTLSIALGLAQVITGGIDIRSVPEAMTDFSTYIKILGIPALPFVALVVVIIGGIVLHKTKFGRYTYAVGSNEEAARRVGVHVGDIVTSSDGDVYGDGVNVASRVQGLTEPHMTGLGGDAFILIYLAKTREVKFINATGQAPLAANGIVSAKNCRASRPRCHRRTRSWCGG